MDGFSKFKRQMLRIDRSYNRILLSLKIYFRFGREMAFCLVTNVLMDIFSKFQRQICGFNGIRDLGLVIETETFLRLNGQLQNDRQKEGLCFCFPFKIKRAKASYTPT